MNKIIIPVLASVLILGTLGLTQQADAATITLSDEASCLAIPGTYFESNNCNLNNDFTVNAGDTLIIENIFVTIQNSKFTNFGTVELIGAGVGAGGFMQTSGDFIDDDEIINECGGIINANGNNGSLSGSIILHDGTMTNKGTVNLFGSFGDGSGTLGAVAGTTINNHSVINENPGTGQVSGIVFHSGVDPSGGIFNDNLPDLCVPTFDSLREQILALDLPDGLTNALISKVDAAEQQFENGNFQAAINILEAYVNHAEAQTGKKIDAADAAALIESADILIDFISSEIPGNTPPTIESVTVTAENVPGFGWEVTCTANGVNDADGDNVTLSYEWTNHLGQIFWIDDPVWPALGCFSNEITCTVTPSDGNDLGEPVSGSHPGFICQGF